MDRRFRKLVGQLARNRFRNALHVMIRRIDSGEAKPFIPPDASHWLAAAWYFMAQVESPFRSDRRLLDFYAPQKGRNDFKEGRFAHWVSNDDWASLPIEAVTHFFSSDVYPVAPKPKRSKENWVQGPWGPATNLICEDNLLSSDGMHLWMWCLVPYAHERVAVDFYTLPRFQALMDSDKYKAMFPGMTGRQLRSLVFTFHTGGQYPEIRDDHFIKYRCEKANCYDTVSAA